MQRPGLLAVVGTAEPSEKEKIGLSVKNMAKQPPQGIYVKQAFHFNLKCVVFGTLMCAVYIFSACRVNKWMLLPIFVISYVGMAWYDYFYNCDKVLKSGSTGLMATFDSIFKPQYRGADLTRWQAMHAED
jgi:hypothetical protein